MIEPIWMAYKSNFGSTDFIKSESYKWPVLKQVYEKWKWNLHEDNSSMFEQAFRVKGPKNLWTSRHFYPIAMYTEMLKELPAEANKAMNELFDESVELYERLNTFVERIEHMRTKLQELHPTENKANHYHGDLRAASLYLTLQYPEKYLLYKSSIFHKTIKLLNLNIQTTDSTEKYIQYIQLGLNLRNYIQSDAAFYQQYQSFISDSKNYHDPYLHLLVQDFIYFIAIYFEDYDNSSPAYWIFQGNPKTYDIVASLRANAVKSWTVTAHKDKIKPDDKVILWVTGEEAGCYALCKVTSKVEKRKNDESEQRYYINESPNESHDRVSLEIEYNLSDNPVLKESLSKLPEFVDFKAGNQGTNYKATKVQYQKLLTMVKNNIKSDKKNNNSNNSLPLNQILYGPPGTGKTYNTIDEALRIINPEFYQANKGNRDVLKHEFNRLIIKDIESDDQGRIAFVTFHQSMSYEDFIEGIKPVLTALDEETAEQGESITYKVQKGIFRHMCDKAALPVSIDIDFNSSWEKFVNHLMKQKAEVIFRSTSSELKLEKESSTPDGLKLRFKKSWDTTQEQGQAVFHVGKSTIQKIFNQRVNLTDPELRQWVAIRDIVGGGRATTHLAVYKSFFEFANLSESFKNKKKDLPYVLIIDEINRGNISQIFGELITLIEEDKRLGKAEALQAVLPYSKEKFSVPQNLFIIGTMNTADRSIEALDTALRRRFTFIEMPPKPEIIREHGKSKGEIDGIDLIKLLETINKRIEKLLDKDHQIGHSYFMDIEGLDALKLTFTHKIIPLLEEYFYGDMGKIGLVLGSGFVKPKHDESFYFADFKAFDDDTLSDLKERRVFEIIDPKNLQIDDFKKIYQL